MVPSMVLHCTVPCHAAWACDNTRPPHTHTHKKKQQKKNPLAALALAGVQNPPRISRASAPAIQCFAHSAVVQFGAHPRGARDRAAAARARRERARRGPHGARSAGRGARARDGVALRQGFEGRRKGAPARHRPRARERGRATAGGVLTPRPRAPRAAHPRNANHRHRTHAHPHTHTWRLAGVRRDHQGRIGGARRSGPRARARCVRRDGAAPLALLFVAPASPTCSSRGNPSA